MAKFKVVTQKPAGVTFDLADGQYQLERLALDPIDAEIVEIDASSEEEFIREAKGADAVIARGRRISREIIESLDNCKVISLGSVGADTVDVDAATDRGIPVTNVPDTFIEEVADHTIMMLLASFRRLNVLDQMVRENWGAEGRPFISEFPRLWGQTIGFISLPHQISQYQLMWISRQWPPSTVTTQPGQEHSLQKIMTRCLQASQAVIT